MNPTDDEIKGLNNLLRERTPAQPGWWLAVDPNQQVQDEDTNSNRLIERVMTLPEARQRQLKIVYVFPANFV